MEVTKYSGGKEGIISIDLKSKLLQWVKKQLNSLQTTFKWSPIISSMHGPG